MRFQERPKGAKQWQLDLFEKLNAREPVDTKNVDMAFCVLSTPRSGSTFFCECLNNTGLLGHTEEWFNAEYFYAWQQVTDKDFTLSDYVTWVIERTQQDTGVFGVHWHIAQVFAMEADFKFNLGNFKFNHVFYIRRRDKYAQAVSLAKALKANQFRSYEECKNDSLPLYSDIARSLHIIVDHEDAYKTRLAGPRHQEIWYEEFTSGPAVFNRVMRTLGKEPQATYSSATKVQQNVATRELLRNFKAYLRGEE